MVYLIYLYLEFSGNKCCQMFQILQRHQSTCTEKGTNFSKWHAAFIFGLNTRKHAQFTDPQRVFRPLLFLHDTVICCWANDASEKCHAVIVLTPPSIKTRVTRLSRDYFHIVLWLSYVNTQKLCLVWVRHCQITDLVKDTQQRTIFSVPRRNCDGFNKRHMGGVKHPSACNFSIFKHHAATVFLC